MEWKKYVGVFLKGTKVVVFLSLIYTSIVMYQLENYVVSGVIGAVALFYVILNKLDSIM